MIWDHVEWQDDQEGCTNEYERLAISPLLHRVPQGNSSNSVAKEHTEDGHRNPHIFSDIEVEVLRARAAVEEGRQQRDCHALRGPVQEYHDEREDLPPWTYCLRKVRKQRVSKEARCRRIIDRYVNGHM